MGCHPSAANTFAVLPAQRTTQVSSAAPAGLYLPVLQVRQLASVVVAYVQQHMKEPAMGLATVMNMVMT